MLEKRGIGDEMNSEHKCALVTGKGDDLLQISLPRIGGEEDINAKEILSPAALARTWDPDTIAAATASTGAAAAAAGYNVFCVPSAAVARDGEAGFAEDPYLAGKTAAAYARGVQKTGITACLSDYPLALNGRNATVDERALRELYITPNEIAVREGGARCVAFGEGKLNGIDVRRCAKFAAGTLRKEFGFKGAAICAADDAKTAACALSAGIDLVLPRSPQVSGASVARAVAVYRQLKEKDTDKKIMSLAVRTGEAVSPASVNAAAERVIALVKSSRRNDFTPRADAVGRAAAASIVLLKNKDGVLPLKSGARIALAGLPDAIAAADKKIAAGAGMTIVGSAGGFDDAAVKGACLLAEKADAALVFIGSDGLKRLPEGQINLLKALKSTRARVLAALVCDRGIETSWDADCDALLLAGGLNDRAANAVLAAAAGVAEPTGRLTASISSTGGFLPKIKDREGNEQFRESVFVGYRRYGKAGIAVKYPFGFGLGYTSFAFSDLAVGDDRVTFCLTNTGARDGEQVAQMYVGKRDSAVMRPDKELKGFVKVFVKAGETVRVTIPFDNYTFRYYNTATGKWEIEAGDYEITVGASAADAALCGRVTLKGTGAVAPYAKAKMPAYAAGDALRVDKKEYDRLIAFDSRVDLAVAKKSMRRRKLLSALIAAVILIAVDIIITATKLIPTYIAAVVILIVVNLVIYGFTMLIVCAAAVVIVPSKRRSYLSPASKEDNAYMIFGQSPETAAAEDAAETASDNADFAAPVMPSVDVPFAAAAAAVNAYCSAEKVSFAELCARFVRFAADSGLTVAVADARVLFAAMAGARLVVLKNASPQLAERIARIVGAFFGGSGAVVKADAETSAAELVASLAPALRAADGAAISVCTLTGVTPDNFACADVFLPFLQTPVRPLTLNAADGGVKLPRGLWLFAVPAAGANYRAFNEAFARCAGAVEITAGIKGEDGGKVNESPVSFDSWKGAVRAAKETRYVREDLWKKLDDLEEWADGKAGFAIGNKLFRAAEDFTSVFMACGGDDTEALDAAIAAMIVPVLAAYPDAPFKDGENGLSETLERLFGADNIALSMTAVKRLGID